MSATEQWLLQVWSTRLRRAQPILMPPTAIFEGIGYGSWRAMIPSNLRLLQSARKTVNDLGQQSLPGSVASSLKALDLVLNELMLRQSMEFYREYCDQGRALI